MGMNLSGPGQSAAAQEDVSTEAIVHYFRPDGDYTDWNLWMWPSMPNNQAGAEYDFTGSDAFGMVAEAQVPSALGDYANAKIGIIVFRGELDQQKQIRDVEGDRFINVSGPKVEIWLIQGDPTIYYSEGQAGEALKPAFHGVFLDAPNLINATYSINGSFENPITLGSGASGFIAFNETSRQQIPVASVSATTRDGTTVYALTLGCEPDVTHTLKVRYNGATSGAVVPRQVLDNPRYYYDGNDLGVTYEPESTTFRLWAPVASAVRLRVLRDSRGAQAKTFPMMRDRGGTWFKRVDGNLKGQYYLFEVTNQGKAEDVVDPYARNVSVNGTYGQIVDLCDTNPTDWDRDEHVRLEHREDGVIYEVHVRDFSIDESSGVTPDDWRGKYCAFTLPDTSLPGDESVATCVAHLKKLDVTHVELLPIAGCGSLDEVKGSSTDLVCGSEPDPSGKYRYNWCYDPRDDNVPNGAYATTPEGTARITEVKKMVQALHDQQLGVIMDVVYAHVYDKNTSRFDSIVPRYYFRTDARGNYTNGSGVGNEVAAERPMVRKFILDSVAYWMTQYHIDGFRFDQLSLLGKKTVLALRDTIRSINQDAIILGEPWEEDNSGLPVDEQFTYGAQKRLDVAVFNGHLLDAIARTAGDTDPVSKGYATGDPTATSSSGGPTVYARVITSIPGGIAYSASVYDFTRNPDEAINYASCHDDFTLWDHINFSHLDPSLGQGPNIARNIRISMDKLAQTIVFTCQGIPFMQGGEEFLRTKGTDLGIARDTDHAGDCVNLFDWSLKSADKNKDVFDYYVALIGLRRAHPAFRMSSRDMIRRHLRFLKAPPKVNVINFQLTDRANSDEWNNIEVIFNPTDSPQDVQVGPGEWTVVAEKGEINVRGLGSPRTGTVTVDPYSATIMHGGEPGDPIDPMAK